MFERRTRIVLVGLVLICLGLLLRAGQLQIAQAGDWRQVAAEALRRSTLTETTRGRIVDVKGRVMAEDVPCNDAAIAYWFVRDPVDPKQLEQLARDLARQTPGYYEAETAEQLRRVEQQVPNAQLVLDNLWDTLAEVGGVTREEIDETRRTIISRVEMRRRHLVHSRYDRAVERHEDAELSPWWRRWLLGEAEAPPELADFEEPIAEEEQAHVVLHNLTDDQYNALVKLSVDLPPTLRRSVQLRASRTRHYPQGPVSAHVIGRIGQVDREDVANDPELHDERRRYLPGDLAGRSGLEKLGERMLRGDRGRIDLDLESDTRHIAYEPEAGQDVVTTIDAALSADIRTAFENVDFRWAQEPGDAPGASRTVTSPMPGAAVVIDVKTGAVRAMVSYPDFDPNKFDEEFERLNTDELARPTLNRATSFAAVPGSTVKPIVGLGAISAGVMHSHDTIECTGYLIVDVFGKTIRLSKTGRCWTAKMYGQYSEIQGHQIPSDPHPTPGLNPFQTEPGHLTFADALQRSCNIFFETLGHRGGTEQLSQWLEQFGLGRATGIGLPEQYGMLPRDATSRTYGTDAMGPIRNNWFAAIGQGSVQATPLQMANATATLARDGIWMRPTLLAEDLESAWKERVDLHLDREALDLMHRGMEAVVHSAGGSGHGIDDRLPLRIGGKTGSAQAHLLTIAVRDGKGEVVRDGKGRAIYRRVDDLSTRVQTNPYAPWYRRSNSTAEAKPEVTHAWFIGYAPAENPTVAFAVFVEYGGSGGVSAGSVAAQIVQALVKHGYLEATRERDPRAPEGEVRYVVE